MYRIVGETMRKPLLNFVGSWWLCPGGRACPWDYPTTVVHGKPQSVPPSLSEAPDSARIHVRSTSPWIPWEPKWYELLVGWGISWHIQQGSWMQHNIQPNHCGIFRSIVNQWIGLRENLQESPYLMGKSMVSCKFSLKPIQSLKGILDTAGWTHR